MAARIVPGNTRQTGRRFYRRAAGAACWLAGRWPVTTCCKLARQGKHAAGGHWVIWVIWVIVLNCKPAALGRWPLGHLGHTKNNDPSDLKGADLAPREFPALGHLGHFVIE